MTPGSWRYKLVTLILLWLAGVYLRLPVLIAPPLVPMIDAELGLNQTQLGALTTLPVLMLSLGALPGALIIARLGPRITLVLAILAVGLASMARGLAPPLWLLFVNTTLLGLAIAVMQPAFPALVLRWCPGFAALGSAVYMNGMLMGEFIGGGLTLPLVMPFLENDWRAALVFWSLPALPVALLVLMSRRLGIVEVESGASGAPVWKPPLNRLRTWHLGIILGTASAGFFGSNAYVPGLLAGKGTPEALPDYLLIINGTQVIGSLTMLVLARIWVGRRFAVIITSWSTFLGLLGMVLASGVYAATATALVGLATCMQLILTVALVPQISDTREAASLAAGMFVVGYMLGFIVPLLGGVAADALSLPAAAFVPVAILAFIGIVVAHSSPHLEARHH